MVNPLQLLLITIAITIVSYDVLMTQVCVKCAGESVILGLLVGAIMGDVKTGLLVGGTMQLMSLGLAGYGGASVPNYRVGTTVGTVFAITTGGGLEVALVVGIPAATLGVQLDVLAKMVGTYFTHEAAKAAGKDLTKMAFGGVDAVDQALDEIKADKEAGEGAYRATCDNTPYAHGMKDVDIAEQLFDGETFNEQILIPAKAVTWDNIDDYFTDEVTTEEETTEAAN